MGGGCYEGAAVVIRGCRWDEGGGGGGEGGGGRGGWGCYDGVHGGRVGHVEVLHQIRVRIITVRFVLYYLFYNYLLSAFQYHLQNSYGSWRTKILQKTCTFLIKHT